LTIKSFSTAAQQAEAPAFEGAEQQDFEIDGEKFVAYPPTGAQLALAMAAQSQHSTTTERIRGLVDFLDSILDEQGQARFRERLLDRDDPFDMSTVEAVILWLTEQWSARPTQSPSGSRPSPRGSGRRLTATQPSVGATS
jgi:hypothetical protein